MRKGPAVFLSLALALVAASARAERLEIIWPTPNTAYFEGKSISDFVQPTASGEPESGLFGCHRTNGAQFHEGVDLKPVKRDRHGEPIDPIFVVMPGTVRHINRVPGDSNYGRYIVVEHGGVTPAIYTLYAHLSAIAEGLKAGDSVERGQTIATMGRSSSGLAIPKDRAHLHFEVGVMLTRQFQSWYDWKKFGSRNDHALWNGMNLLGFDPLEFYDAFRARRVDDFQGYFGHMQTAVKLRIATRTTPDYAERYPSLVSGPLPAGGIAGWEVKFNEMGLPFAWTPLSAMDLLGYRPDEIRVIEVNEPILKSHRCKSLVFSKRGSYAIGKDLDMVLQLLFGFRKEL